MQRVMGVMHKIIACVLNHIGINPRGGGGKSGAANQSWEKYNNSGVICVENFFILISQNVFSPSLILVSQRTESSKG